MNGRAAWTLVPYTTGHRDEVLTLMALVQGRATTPDEFVWEFERNPAGEPNIQLAIADGSVVAVACHNLFRMRVADHEEAVSFSLNVLTHPEFRGQGLFSALELACEERATEAGVRVMLSFPNALSEPIFLSKLGWQAIPGPRIVARLLSIGHLTAAWRPALAGPTGVIDPLLRWARPTRAAFELRRVDRFGRWTDDLDMENAEGLNNCIVRSAEYLNWRFLDDPAHRYDAFLVEANGDAVGYVIIGSTTKRGIRFTYLANALLRPSWWNSYAAVRGAAIRQARSWKRVAAALDLQAPNDISPRPGRNLYVPTPKRLRFIAKTPSPVPSAQWFFQLGDLDFF